MEDAIFVVFLCMVIWLASEFTDNDGNGGRRARVPVA